MLHLCACCSIQTLRGIFQAILNIFLQLDPTSYSFTIYGILVSEPTNIYERFEVAVTQWHIDALTVSMPASSSSSTLRVWAFRATRCRSGCHPVPRQDRSSRSRPEEPLLSLSRPSLQLDLRQFVVYIVSLMINCFADLLETYAEAATLFKSESSHSIKENPSIVDSLLFRDI